MKKEGTYSIIHIRVYGFDYYYKDYAARKPEELIDAWTHGQTVRAFAGEDSEEIDVGTFAWLEQEITVALEHPELYEGVHLDENLLFSAYLDVDQNRFKLYSRDGNIEMPLSLSAGKEDNDTLEFADKTDVLVEENLNNHSREKVRLFVDMDGVLAKFNPVDTLETLYEPGYFLNLEPQETVIEAVKKLIDDPRVEVFILSSVLSDSPFALSEKHEWLATYLPEVDEKHQIFPPCGKDKKRYVPEGIRETDCLLDDYTVNLSNWEPPARGIKLLNGINHTKGTWKGTMVNHELTEEEMYQELVKGISNPVLNPDMAVDQKSIKI